MGTNLSKIKRENLLEFIENLKQQLEEENDTIFKLTEVQSQLTKTKYGLVWEEHKEKVDEEIEIKVPVFVEDKNLELVRDNKKPINFLLEGDNLHSLYLLEKTHKGSIDAIYIDPPYNKGNKDFIYDDDYVDKEDGFRHSKWISFMEKRLKVAHSLLKEDGIIFISIDDYEQAHLKILCDEIFGENNFVSSVIWQKKTGASDAKGIATITEYIVTYIKNSKFIESAFSRNNESYDLKRYREKDEFYNERGPYYLDNLDRGGLRYSDSANYGIEAPDGTMVFPNGRTTFINDGWTWKWGKDKVEWAKKNKFIEIIPSTNKSCGWAVKYKNYLNVDNEGKKIERSAPHKNIITSSLNSDASKEIKLLFSKNVFSYSKPTNLIKTLISFVNKKEGIFLDFFAGSGTTGQAIMELNKEDGGKRTFILCTNNQNGICRDVTYNRLKKVIDGYEFNGKKEEVLYLKKLALKDLKSIDEILEEIDALENMSRSKFDKITKSFKDGVLKVVGVKNIKDKVDGMNGNLKYYKTEFVDRISNDCDIKEKLIEYIESLIQLENGIDIKDTSIKAIYNDDEADKLIEDISSLEKCKRIYISDNVLLTRKQENILEKYDIEIFDIPKYYFENEIREDQGLCIAYS